MFATRPQGWRYLGFLRSNSAGVIGAFFKGDDPMTLKIGYVEGSNWKLVNMTDVKAEFQNLKYQDMRVSIEVRDFSGAPGNNPNAVTNEF